MTRRVRARKGATIEERLRLHMIEAPSGCWIWVGARDEHHYGRVTVDGKTQIAHRVSYETFIGPIPDGLHIDHLCRRPACIKPLHLEPVTVRTNMLRGTSPGARAARRDRCLRGHPYSEHAVTYAGRRYCRACMAMHHRKYYKSAKAEREAERADKMAELIAFRDRNVA